MLHGFQPNVWNDRSISDYSSWKWTFTFSYHFSIPITTFTNFCKRIWVLTQKTFLELIDKFWFRLSECWKELSLAIFWSEVSISTIQVVRGQAMICDTSGLYFTGGKNIRGWRKTCGRILFDLFEYKRRKTESLINFLSFKQRAGTSSWRGTMVTWTRLSWRSPWSWLPVWSW